MKSKFTLLKCFLAVMSLWVGHLYGQSTQTFKANSFIVNMGVAPQTVSNGLKPYGLVYDLVKNYNVPVSWVINPNKTKDGVDFAFQGTQFRGGTFIIPAEFRTPEVEARITYWQGQGVVGVHTSNPLTLDIVYNVITSVPRWTLDLKNGSIALSYLNNAMIPSTAYNYKEPQKLDCCDDLFAMPHADPTWATHSNLYFWNQNCKGGIWAACHAVSALENSINPSNASQQMNFLSNRDASKTTPTPWPSNSLTLWGSHSGGSPAYVTRLATDPVQQYIGTIDAATQNGSEQIYLPIQAGSPSWNPGAKVLVYDPTQANVPDPKSDLSKAAVAAIYGRGFDDADRGFVMYEAGHSHAKSSAPENVAAQRAFINFSFLNQFERVPVFNAFSTPPAIMNATQGPYNFSVDAVSAFGGSLHYEWKSSCGGTFSAPNANTTTFSPPTVNSTQQCIISVIITDQCGRSNSHSWGVTINQGPQPPVALNDTIHISTGCGGIDPVTIHIGSNDSDPDGDPLAFSLLGTGTGGTWVNTGGGILRYTPSDNFSGTAVQQYRVCDNTTNPGALCDTAYAVVVVGTTDEHGCLSNQVYGFTGDYQHVTAQSAFAGTITNGANIVGEADELFAQIGNNNAATIQVDMGVLAPAGRTFRMIWKSVNTNVSTVTIAYSSNGTSFTNLSGSISTVTDHSEFQESEFVLPAAARYLRIIRSAGTPQIDAIGFEEYGCVSRAPQAANNTVTMLEDLPVQVNVLANDLDPAGEVLSLRRIVSSPKRGTVSVNLNGTITYVNNTDISGRDTLTYEVCNTSGYCSTAYVYFNSVDDACSAGQYKPYTVGGAITKTFQYGFTGTNAASANNDILKFKDTYINQGSTNNNYGGVNKVEAGKVPNLEERLLNYFDISEIPTNAIVQSATFSLYGKGGDKNSMTFTIENLNATFTENQVNWNNRATATPWTAPGAGSNVGAVWSSITIGTIKNVRYEWEVSALVESWLTTPANNHGMLIRQNGSVNKKKQFATKEGNLAERPILTVTYVVPAPCTAITNRVPLAQPDFATVKSTDTVWVKPLTNDKDPDTGNTISLSGVAAVTNGTAITQGDSLRFIPTFGFNGIATVQYIITDNFGAKDTALIRITCTNAAPIAENDTATGLSESTFVIHVKSNDMDPEGDSLSVPSVIMHPKHGEAKAVGSTIEYIPNDGFTGKDTIKYSVCETIFTPGDCNPILFCDSAYVYITVENRPPVANDDTKVTYLCFESIFNILGNDTNPEQTDVVISIIEGPHRGTVRIGEDDRLYYKANNGLLGKDTIVYIITDTDNPPLSDTARVYIDIKMPVNNPPVAMDDYEETGLYETLYASVLDNDEDPNGDPLTVSLPLGLLQPSKGTAEVLPNGLIKYIPFPGAFGMDSLDYQICEGAITDTSTCLEEIGFCDVARVYIDIKVFNTTFAVDDENSTWKNTPVSGNVTTNDFDPEGNTQNFDSFLNQNGSGNSITSGSTVSGKDKNGNPVTNAGTLTFGPNGTYTYTPANNFTGNISVPYSICDDGIPIVCDTAYLDITVSDLPNINNSVIANNDEYFSNGNTISSNVTVNDTDPQGDDFTVTSYRYDSNGNGIPDATGTIGSPIQVGGVREDGVSVPNAGSLTQNADGTFTFVPAPGFVGQITYNYTITDDGTPVAKDDATVVITVIRDENGPLNDPPFAGDDFSYTSVNTPVNGCFVCNDYDLNDDPISHKGITIDPNGPATPIDTLTTEGGGQVVLKKDGTYTYYPPTGYVGPDRVVYEICDVTVIEPQPLCAKATIHTLIGIKNTTHAVNDENSTWVNTPVSGDVTTNDFDLEGNTQNFGSFLNQNGSGNPITSGTTVSGKDKNGNPVTNAGTLTFGPNGTYTYTPANNFTGNISVPYSICDNGSPVACDTAYLDITVSDLPNINNSVIANNDEYFSNGNTISSNVTVNDADPQGDNFTVTSYKYDSNGDGIPDATGTIGSPIQVGGVREDGIPVTNAGSLTQNTDGTFTFVPAPGFVGQVTYNYTITDNGTPVTKDDATVVITVIRDENGPKNDPPIAGDDFSYTSANTPVDGCFVCNDYDLNNDPISHKGITIDPNDPATPIDTLTTAQGGTVVIKKDGTYTYYPPTDYIGPDRVVYDICDVTVIEPQPLCADATIHLLVGTGYKISGAVLNDANGMVDNKVNGSGTNVNGKVYAVLTDINGNVIASVPVDEFGNYEFTNVPGGIELQVVLDTVSRTKGDLITTALIPNGWVHTGEVIGTGNGSDGNTNGISASIPALTKDVENVNFGIERPPVADSKIYNVANNLFSEDSLAGFPNLSTPGARYFSISTGNPSLTGYTNNGLLTGKDAEDCPQDQACNASSTFKIDSIYTGTILFYNYGGETGIRQLSPNDVIPNYNPAQLVIYAIEGSGMSNQPVGFNYSMVDAANKSSQPASYIILTESALPVELLFFKASLNECKTSLVWATASELNNDYFEVQRSSNLTNWATIGTVNGHGSSNQRVDYQFEDGNSLSGISYYRLKQVDYDGTIEYHRIVSIDGAKCFAASVKIFPVPAQNILNVNMNLMDLQKVQLTIVDASGKRIRTLTNVNATNQIDLRHIPNGSYFLQINLNNHQVETYPFSIMK